MSPTSTTKTVKAGKKAATRPSAPAPAAPGPFDTQPISHVMWLPRTALSGNAWNPNRQAPPENQLLKTSIIENGWTQPVVARDHGTTIEIVDGYHRWASTEDPAVGSLTDNHVPVVVLPPTDEATARMATIRHNRARGTHHVLGMAAIVAELIGLGVTPDQIRERLGMDAEEVTRLADRGDMLKRHAPDSFNNGWTVG